MENWINISSLLTELNNLNAQITRYNTDVKITKDEILTVLLEENNLIEEFQRRMDLETDEIKNLRQKLAHPVIHGSTDNEIYERNLYDGIIRYASQKTGSAQSRIETVEITLKKGI